jgi:hypothetical protein
MKVGKCIVWHQNHQSCASLLALEQRKLRERGAIIEGIELLEGEISFTYQIRYTVPDYCPKAPDSLSGAA